MWIYNQLFKSYEFGYFSNWHPPQTANIENPGETFFKNFYVKKFLPIYVLCAERDYICVTNLCKKVLSPILDFFSVPS